MRIMRYFKTVIYYFFLLILNGAVISCNIISSDENINVFNNTSGKNNTDERAFFLSVRVGIHGNCLDPQPNAKVTITYSFNGEPADEEKNTDNNGWASFMPTADYGTLIEINTQYNGHYEVPCPVSPPISQNVYVYTCLNDTVCD